jgi:peroxiredoxin
MIFKAQGASLVAISPQSIEASAKMKSNASLEFPLLSDARYEYAEGCDLAFALDDEFFQELNSVVPDYNGNNDWLLPVPVTYVIDTDGTIVCLQCTYQEILENEFVLSLLCRLYSWSGRFPSTREPKTCIFVALVSWMRLTTCR